MMIDKQQCRHKDLDLGKAVNVADQNKTSRSIDEEQFVKVYGQKRELYSDKREDQTALQKLLKTNRYMRMIRKIIKNIQKNGLGATVAKVGNKLRFANAFKKLSELKLYTEEELNAQRQEVFPKDIKISILVPLYNTPEMFLREMIQSVLDQTYSNWELCLSDGSDTAHSDVADICMEYVQKDKRVRYRKLEKNLGISGNTNVCIEMSTGDYIALFDHDDLLHPAALHDVMKEICEKKADFIYTDEVNFRHTRDKCFNPHFKPDYAPDTLRSYNYICHLSVFSRNLLEKAGGGFRSEFDGSQDYDLILRLTEQAENIVHIPRILYYWRSHANSVASDISVKPYTLVAAKKALSQHLERMGLQGQVQDSVIPSIYKIDYKIQGNPLVSILIHNKNDITELKKCIESVKNGTYQNWEMIVIDNNSTEPSDGGYYTQLVQDRRIRVVKGEKEQSAAAMNNIGVQNAKGEYVLLLKDNAEFLTSDSLEQMLMLAQRRDVGAVGAMLYYPNDTVQHAGGILGIGGIVGDSHKHFPRGATGYMNRMAIVQNYSSVSAACMMIRREIWDEMHGLDKILKNAYYDVDLCMRLRENGYLIVWTPYVELYFHKYKNRSLDYPEANPGCFSQEREYFQKRWEKALAAGDPYYNRNLTLDRGDFSLK